MCTLNNHFKLSNKGNTYYNEILCEDSLRLKFLLVPVPFLILTRILFLY